jgi:hypothetical protein
MKKIMLIVSIVAVALIALGVAGLAYAQSQTPPASNGWGMMGGFGGRGGMMWRGVDAGGYGPMHDYMVKALAKALGMTPEDLQARFNKGDSLWTVAKEKGLTQQQFSDLFKQARTDALKAMVADGIITQAQADWMLDHMNDMMGNGSFVGGCMGGGFGPGQGGGRWNSQPALPTDGG